MKKLILTAALMVMAIAINAQNTIAPEMTEGKQVAYAQETSIQVAGQKEIKIKSEDSYTVSKASPDGPVITITTTKVEADIDESDITAQMVVLPIKMLCSVPISVQADKNGQPLKVLNTDEVKAAVAKKLATLADKLYESVPQLTAMMPKEALIENLGSTINEETLLKQLTAAGPLTLAGKTPATGATESYVNSQQMKMKRMYFVTGKSIITNSTLDMTKDELKEMIIKQVTEQAPEQAEVIKQNIDMFMGQMKFEATEKATYQLGDDQWPTSIKEESNQDMMGQSIKQTSTTTRLN